MSNTSRLTKEVEAEEEKMKHLHEWCDEALKMRKAPLKEYIDWICQLLALRDLPIDQVVNIYDYIKFLVDCFPLSSFEIQHNRYNFGQYSASHLLNAFEAYQAGRKWVNCSDCSFPKFDDDHGCPECGD